MKPNLRFFLITADRYSFLTARMPSSTGTLWSNFTHDNRMSDLVRDR